MIVKGKSARKPHDVLFMSLQLVCGVIVGVLVAAGWLALKPVTILDAPPTAGETAKAKKDRHEVVYVRGRPPGRGAQGARKQKQFLDRTPGEIAFAEEDVNRWLTGVYASKERTIRVEGIDLTMGPRVPSVRLLDDQMEIGLEIGLDRAGGNRTLVVQARGHFIPQDGRQVFVPRRIYLGSCPLPWNLGGRLLFDRLAALYPVSENVEASWSALESAAVRKGRLHLVVAGVAPAAPQVPAEPAAQAAPTPATIEPVANPADHVPPADVPAAGIPAADAPSDANEAIPAAPIDPVPTPQQETPAPAAVEPAPVADAPPAAPVADPAPPESAPAADAPAP